MDHPELYQPLWEIPMVQNGLKMNGDRHARIQRGWGTGGPDPPEKSPKYRVS